MNNGLVEQQWICDNSHYCNGRVTNHKDRKECRNCGMRIDDKRKTKPIQWKTVHSKCLEGKP